MRRGLGVADQHGVVLDPRAVGDIGKVAPQRAVDDQRMAVELLGEHALEHRQHLRFAQFIEPEIAPGLLIHLDHPGRALGLVLVDVGEQHAFFGFTEKVFERIERLGRAQPGEFVGPQVDARLEMVLVLLADARVDAVGDHDEIGVGEFFQSFDLALEAHLHAELAPAVLQDVEQCDARAAAEAVAARAQCLAFVDDIDVAPIGEAPADALVSHWVVGLEGIERLVGEHHAEAEGVVRAVSLVDGDVPARPGFLREQREVQPACPAANHGDFHDASGITAVASISSRASGSISPPTCTTAMVGKCRPMSARYAVPTSLSAARYSCLSITYQVSRTMCCGLPPACASTSMMFASVWRNCPAKSRASHLPSPVQPTWPAMKTNFPLAAMPLAKPLARAQPGGCRICIMAVSST